MVLPIYTYGTSVLREKAKPVRNVDEKLIQLVMDMFDTMRAADGIGLAANQVGSLQRVLVIDISEIEESKESGERALEIQPEGRRPLVLINPDILSYNGSLRMEEGCLSVPGIRDEVERAQRITVKYKDTNFRDVELKAYGLLARVIMHELDHLNGILFTDLLSPERKKAQKEALKELQRGNVDAGYPVVTAATKKKQPAISKRV
jgi:peptide deformylase